MSTIEIEEPISDTIADAVFGVGHNNEQMLESAFQSMLHSPLPWDVILLMGIYDYSKTTGLNMLSVTRNNKLKTAQEISRYPATMREIMPALTYMSQLHDGVEDNEELTPGVLSSLIHLLWLIIYRITDDERFELGTLTIAVAIEESYRKHLETSLQFQESGQIQS